MNRLLSSIVVLASLLGSQVAAIELLHEERDCVIGPHEVVDVGSALPGQLESVAVERSDTVRAGQELARLESGVERMSLELARAWASIDSEIRIEETSQGLERRRSARISQLYSNSAVALEDKDRAETEVSLAALRLRQAREKRWIREIDARKAQAALERRTVRSPIDGVVVERFRAAGEYVENQPIVRIAMLDPLEVETVLPMALFGQVASGMVAEVRAENAPGEVHRAVVRLVDRMGDAASGTFGVRLSLPNPDSRIPAGLKCSLNLVPDEVAPVQGREALPLTPSRDPATAPSLAPSGDPATSPSLEPARSSAQALPFTPAGEPATALPPTRPPAPATAPAERAAPAPVAPDAPASPDEPAPVVEAALVVEADPSAHDCSAVGPLDTVAAADALADALAARGAAARVEVETVSEKAGFIVVTPPEPDRDAARRLAKRLGADGVRHRDVVNRGPFANRVSVGVYAGAMMAERRRAEVAALGVVVETLERERTLERWWVLAGTGAPAVLEPALTAGLTVGPRACGAPLRRAELPASAGVAS